MAKRFTSTDKWKDVWFTKLSNEFKIAYIYILDNCDQVGVWDPNFELANFQLKAQIEWSNLFLAMGHDRVLLMNTGAWWLKKFCTFQYGILTDESKSKTSQFYIKLLKQHSLWIVYTKGIYSPKEKDKEKDKEQEKEQGTEPETLIVNNGIFIKISGKLIPQKPSEWLEENKTTAMDVFLMQNKGKSKEQILKEVDTDYMQYDFDDHNHVFNTFKFVALKTTKKIVQDIAPPLPKGLIKPLDQYIEDDFHNFIEWTQFRIKWKVDVPQKDMDFYNNYLKNNK